MTKRKPRWRRQPRLGKNWFKGMKNHGNNFDILVCPHLYQGKQISSWVTTAYPYYDERCMVVYPLEHSDWDPWMPSGGAATIIKKYIWEKVKWDERLFWNQNEDTRQGHQAFERGFLVRLNPNSFFEALVVRNDKYLLMPVRISKNSKKLGRLKGHPYFVLRKVLYQKFVNFRRLLKILWST